MGAGARWSLKYKPPFSVTGLTKAFNSSADYAQSGESSMKGDAGDVACRIGRKTSVGQLQRVGRCAAAALVSRVSE